MNRLFRYLGDSWEKSSVGVRSPREAMKQPSLQECYDGIALGVECAWPTAAMREVRHNTPT
jgi:hypothetical protein